MISSASSRVSKPSCSFSCSSRNSSSSSLLCTSKRASAKSLPLILSTISAKDHKFNKQVNLANWLNSNSDFSMIEIEDLNPQRYLEVLNTEDCSLMPDDSMFFFDDDDDLILGDDLEQYYYRKKLALQSIDMNSIFTDICTQLDTQYSAVFNNNNCNSEDLLMNFDELFAGNAAIAH